MLGFGNLFLVDFTDNQVYILLADTENFSGRRIEVHIGIRHINGSREGIRGPRPLMFEKVLKVFTGIH